MAKRRKKNQKSESVDIDIDVYLSESVDINSAKMTAEFQKQLRKSKLYKELVKAYGKKKADEMINECKAKVE